MLFGKTWGWRRWLGAGLLGLVLLAGGTEAAINLTPLGGQGLSFAYQRGYSLQAGWLCYGWADGAYHCTKYWSFVNGVATSENTAWVPNVGNRPTIAQESRTTVAAPSGISQWASTGKSAWTMSDVAAIGGNKSALLYPFGQCTWLAAYLGGGNLAWLGNAMDWTANAQARGMATGSTPRVGATVVFQPFDQGASSLGHVAHVIAVYPNGWFQVEEMNFFWNGGGFGKVSYRYVHTDWGTSFIYN